MRSRKTKKIIFSLHNYVKENPGVPKIIFCLSTGTLSLISSFIPFCHWQHVNVYAECSIVKYPIAKPCRVESNAFLGSTNFWRRHSILFLTCWFLTMKQIKYFFPTIISTLRSQGNYWYMWIMKSLWSGLCLRHFYGWLIYIERFFNFFFFFFKIWLSSHYRHLFFLHVFIFPVGVYCINVFNTMQSFWQNMSYFSNWFPE